jgi:hypothetical protein
MGCGCQSRYSPSLPISQYPNIPTKLLQPRRRKLVVAALWRPGLSPTRDRGQNTPDLRFEMRISDSSKIHRDTECMVLRTQYLRGPRTVTLSHGLVTASAKANLMSIGVRVAASSVTAIFNPPPPPHPLTYYSLQLMHTRSTLYR